MEPNPTLPKFLNKYSSKALITHSIFGEDPIKRFIDQELDRRSGFLPDQGLIQRINQELYGEETLPSMQ